MKHTIFVSVVVGIAFVIIACPWAAAQNAFGELNATNIAVNAQPKAPEVLLPEPLAAPVGSSVSLSDATGIREAIDWYKLLFEGRNADLLKKDIWPSMSPKQHHAIKGVFKVVSQVTVGEDCFDSPRITVPVRPNHLPGSAGVSHTRRGMAMCRGMCTCRPQRWRVRDGDEAGGREGSILA